MPKKTLQNKPLVEAIFELHWKWHQPNEDGPENPHYKLLIGGLYEKLRAFYPHHEQLPAASVPDEMAKGLVQHRFRTGKDEWPLVQIGPGILAVNDTQGYTAESFENQIKQAVDAFFDVCSKLDGDLEPDRLLLRYIDAIPFDYEEEEILHFLRDKMKIQITLAGNLFGDTGVSEQPLALDLKFVFPSTSPKGAMHIRFSRGQKFGADALIWETMVESTGHDAPKEQTGIPEWIRQAHTLAEDWFFKLIDGELLERFK